MNKFDLWRVISQEKRNSLVEKYNIKRSGSIMVVDNKIKEDGIYEANLEEVPMEVLMEVAGWVAEETVVVEETPVVEEAEETPVVEEAEETPVVEEEIPMEEEEEVSVGGKKNKKKKK